MERNIFVVIITRNDRAALQEVLPLYTSLISQGSSVVIVDDGSTDGSQLYIKSHAKNILLIENRAHLGYVKSANIGITFALHNRASHVLLLKPTVRFETTIIDTLLQKPSDIIAPTMIKRQNGKEYYGVGGSIIDVIIKPKYKFVGIRPPQSFNATPQFVSFACIGISRKTFERLGLFDEIFLNYYADVDFCLRAKKAGLRLSVSAKTFASQTIGKTNPTHDKIEKHILLHDYILFIKKYRKLIFFPVLVLYMLLLRIFVYFLPKRVFDYNY